MKYRNQFNVYVWEFYITSALQSYWLFSLVSISKANSEEIPLIIIRVFYFQEFHAAVILV